MSISAIWLTFFIGCLILSALTELCENVWAEIKSGAYKEIPKKDVVIIIAGFAMIYCIFFVL
jgi:hypothetical protein